MSIEALLKNLEEVKKPKTAKPSADHDWFGVEKGKEKNLSGFIGKIGDKISVENVKVVTSKYINGYYGSSLLIRMKDKDDNMITTFYSGQANAKPEIGAKMNITGTVKKHDIYNEQKSTVITRAGWTIV